MIRAVLTLLIVLPLCAVAGSRAPMESRPIGVPHGTQPPPGQNGLPPGMVRPPPTHERPRSPEPYRRPDVDDRAPSMDRLPQDRLPQGRLPQDSHP